MNQEVELGCCAVCKLDTHRRCGRCFNIYYCNTVHQRQDWKRHKTECTPKVPKQESSDKTEVPSPSREDPKEEEGTTEPEVTEQSVPQKGSSSGKRRSKKSKKKGIKKEGSVVVSDKQNTVEENSEPSSSTVKHSSVISSVVYTDKELTNETAITHEGSSEQEILSESAQSLSAQEFATASSSNVLRAVNRTDVKMPELPNYGSEQRKEYPEAPLRGSGAPFSSAPNSFHMDANDPFYGICQRVIRDMTQYGVCVLDNFFGKERGQLVLAEVLAMYRSGIFTAGQLVSNASGKEAQTIRSDRITWIDGKEPHCYHINQLISQVDNIILRANKMSNNGKMGDYVINGRTKAMVACYPGSGSHYVKHVDNPNKDGRCITAIYYLNTDWDVKRCGGLLRVFPEGTNKVADIAPIFDRMLFFWSDRRNPHEVQPAYSTRYAITLWYFDAYEREIARREFEQSQPSSSK